MIKPTKEEFPYDHYTWKLVYKDGNDKKICFFDSEYNRKKYIDRYKLKKKEIKLTNKDEK
jgi:hypothetical protein